MRTLLRLAVLAGTVSLSAPALQAQILTLSREQLVKFTAKNPFGRFPDGRPKVPDPMLEQAKGLSVEEAWGVLSAAKYDNQFAGEFRLLHPGKKLAGRAVTAQFMPRRPDVADVADLDAQARGQTKSHNQRVIDLLQPGDVLVVDLFGKIDGGTFVGDNLAAAIFAATKAGFVIDGAVRDLEGIFPLDMAAYFRGVHPASLANVMLTGFNIPIRIGTATVMPGDVVLGDREGVCFIPPHFVEEILQKAEITHIHDEWTKKKFLGGSYKSSDLYGAPLDPKLQQEYEDYLRQKLGAAKYESYKKDQKK
ncbi:MAG: dimethylmenaquinone methyltransferase [Acidimicrobiia bacterium]|nr:dimethylmenaquinone methyltransferase [Acidimicrobiia bacterium]